MLKFLGIGAQKAGTTWLYAQLAKHPQVGFPKGKELHFWNQPAGRDVAAYLAGFGDPLRCEGEITPAYALLPEEVIRQIRQVAPDLRLFFVMRNPVDRAWSSALMALQRAELSAGEVSEQWFMEHFRSAGSLGRGDYAECIRRWRRVFPPEQLLLLRYDDIVSRPEQLLHRCCQHLGVAAPGADMLAACRQAVFAGPQVPIPPQLRAKLVELYRAPVTALEGLLDEDFGAWLMSESAAQRPSVPAWSQAATIAKLRSYGRERLAYWQLRRSRMFDADYYLARYPDVRREGIDPLLHFLRHGAAEKRDPGPAFNTGSYLATYPDVARSGINPLLHYLRHGVAEGRSSSPPAARSSGATAPQAARKSAAPSAPQRARQPFHDFEGYERNSIFLQELTAPFSEHARCVIGHMRAVRRHLATRHAQLPAQPLVSVIAPLGDDFAQAGRALCSVLEQSYADFELIVVGAAGTIPGVPEDPRIHRVKTASNGAKGAALAEGLRCARGEYVAYLGAAEVKHRDFLRVMVGELSAVPEDDLICCAGEVLAPGTGAPVAVRYAPFSRSVVENRDCIDLGRVLHRRSLADRCGGFDPRAGRFAGWEFMLRATESRFPKVLPCILSVDHRSGVAESEEDGIEFIDAYFSRRGIAGRLPGHELSQLASMSSPAQLPRAQAQRKVSIVIPSFECLEYLQLCIESVRAFTEAPYELIVVDNASTQPVRDYLSGMSAQPGVTVIQNDHNYGFTYAVNQGIARADIAADVLLLNNDAVVTEGWVTAMQKVLEDLPETGLVVPRQVLPAGTPTIQTHNPAMNPAREADVNLSMHHGNVLDPRLDSARGYVELSFAPFFCVYIPRRTLDEVGALDFENAPHYWSDNLYCEAVRHIAGRKIVYTPHAKLYHFLQRATSTLSAGDPGLFQDMFVNNEWAAVRQRIGGNSL